VTPRRGSRLVGALLATGALLAAFAATAHGAPEDALPPGGLTLALQDDRLPVVEESGIGGHVDLVASTGVKVTRVDVLWRDVAPTRPANGADHRDPAYRWSRYDQIVDGLTARGIAIMFNVYQAPLWANGGRGPAWVTMDPAIFGDFMAALARRYDGVTPDEAGRAHGPVEMFQPWNEPNLAGFLQPQYQGSRSTSAPLYAGLLREAYGAVKAAQPNAWVIAAGLGPSGTDRAPGSTSFRTFARELATFRPQVDAFAQHLYTAIGPADSLSIPSYRRLDEVIAELDGVRPGLPILITEFGWTTLATPQRESHVSEAEQATYLRQAVELLAANPRVRLAVWFNLQDNALWTSGLRRADLSPKPSWDVFVATPKFFSREPPATPAAPAAPAPASDALAVVSARPATARRRATPARPRTRPVCRRVRRGARLRPRACVCRRGVTAAGRPRRAAPCRRPGQRRGTARVGHAPESLPAPSSFRQVTRASM
jgi:hypothetical protein